MVYSLVNVLLSFDMSSCAYLVYGFQEPVYQYMHEHRFIFSEMTQCQVPINTANNCPPNNCETSTHCVIYYLI